MATQLANWFGLPTFDWAILILDEIDEIPFLDDDDDLRRIDREIVAEMVQPIPNEWEVPPNARDALVDLVVRRANFVADTT